MDGNRHLRSDAAMLLAWNLKAPSSAEPLLQMPGQKFRLLGKWGSSMLKLESLHFCPYSSRRGDVMPRKTATADIRRGMMYGR